MGLPLFTAPRNGEPSSTNNVIESSLIRSRTPVISVEMRLLTRTNWGDDEESSTASSTAFTNLTCGEERFNSLLDNSSFVPRTASESTVEVSSLETDSMSELQTLGRPETCSSGYGSDFEYQESPVTDYAFRITITRDGSYTLTYDFPELDGAENKEDLRQALLAGLESLRQDCIARPELIPRRHSDPVFDVNGFFRGEVIAPLPLETHAGLKESDRLREMVLNVWNLRVDSEEPTERCTAVLERMLDQSEEDLETLRRDLAELQKKFVAQDEQLERLRAIVESGPSVL